VKYSGLIAGMTLAVIIASIYAGNIGAALGFFSALTYEIRLYLHKRL
jgi:hypothetical protein